MDVAMSRIILPAVFNMGRYSRLSGISPEEPPPPEPGETQFITYTEDVATDFMNPERGWMIRQRRNTTQFQNARSGDSDIRLSGDSDTAGLGYTVVWSEMGGDPWNGGGANQTPFRLDNYRNTDTLPTSLHNELIATFADARTAGVKMKVRFAYNYDTDPDTTLARMQTHIAQLAPTVNANRDVVSSMDAGFVGAWGEWHSSTSLVSSSANWWQEPWISARNAVRDALLENFYHTIMIGMRDPRHDKGIRSYYTGSSWQMPLERRFLTEEYPQARVGWYNDCYVTDRSNIGTYNFDAGDSVGNTDRATNAWVGQYAATSGETCSNAGVTSYGLGPAVITECQTMGGPDTLYRKFWTGHYNNWISSGHYKEISRRLGYRLALVNATLPTAVEPNQSVSISLTIKNAGFGKVHNPRPFDLVFVGTGGPRTVRVDPDVRRKLPLGGQTVTSNWTFNIPSSLTIGSNYAVYARFPDPSSALENDDRYSIRLANTGGLWDGNTGRNSLSTTISVVAP